MRSWAKVKGMQVITLAEGASVGKLDDVYFDLEHGRVYGYRIKGGWVWSSMAACASDQLVKLGRDVALVRAEASVEKLVGKGDDPARTWLGDYVGRRVMSRRGEQLGEVADALVDEEKAQLRALLLGDGRLVCMGAHVALGRDAVICDDATVPQAVGDDKIESPEWWARVAPMLG